MNKELCSLPLHALQAGRYQPRQDFNEVALQELAQSIISHGLIEPLVVRRIAKASYELIAGERRWRAAQMAGLKEVPCLVGEYTDKEACALTLVENIQRADLNLIEEATGYKRLIDEFHYHQDELALLVGKSRSHVANIVRLLTLSDSVKTSVAKGLLSLGHARMLVGLDPFVQEHFAHEILKQHWSVRQLEQEIKQFKTHKAAAPSAPSCDIERLTRILAEQLAAPVQIMEEGGRGGWLKVRFFDNDTLVGLLERLGLRYD